MLNGKEIKSNHNKTEDIQNSYMRTVSYFIQIFFILFKPTLRSLQQSQSEIMEARQMFTFINQTFMGAGNG